MSSSSINFASVGNLGGYQGTDWNRDDTIVAASAGFGASGMVAWYRQEGDSIHVHGKFIVGTTAATTPYLQLKSGYVIDFTKIAPTTTMNWMAAGRGYMRLVNTSGALNDADNNMPLTIDGTNNNQLFFPSGGTSGAFDKNTSTSAHFTSGNVVVFDFMVPIVGWTSSTPNGSLVSAYSGTQVGAGGGWTNNTNTAYVDFSAATTSNTLTQIVSQNITAIAEATKMPAITCTLPSTGIYLVTASGSGSSNGSNAAFFRLVDGSGTIINGGQEANLATTQFGPFTLTGIYNATGTTVTFKLQGAATAGNANIAQDTQRPITWSVVKLN